MAPAGTKPRSLTVAGESIGVVSLRDSSIVTMARHGVLDAGQVGAAFRFRNLWLAAQAPGYHRADPLGEHGPLPDACVHARQELQRYRNLLGRHGFILLCRVCGEGWHIRDLYPSRRERDTAADMLAMHLADLDVHTSQRA